MQLTTNTPTKKTILTSALTKKQIEMLQKGNPDALVVYAEEGNEHKEVFRVGYNGSLSCGTIGKFGVTFNSTDKSGHVCVVVNTPAHKSEDDLKQILAEMVLPAQTNLLAIEKSAAQACEDLKKAQDALKGSIEIG